MAFVHSGSIGPPKRAPAKMPGLEFTGQPCPRCGSAMFLKSAPCFLRRRGFSRAARCVGCGFQTGVLT